MTIFVYCLVTKENFVFKFVVVSLGNYKFGNSPQLLHELVK